MNGEWSREQSPLNFSLSLLLASAEQNQRRRSDRDHQLWRSGPQQIGPDAGLGKHTEQVRCSGADFLYTRCLRSTLSPSWAGLRGELALFRSTFFLPWLHGRLRSDMERCGRQRSCSEASPSRVLKSAVIGDQAHSILMCIEKPIAKIPRSRRRDVGTVQITIGHCCSIPLPSLSMGIAR